MLSKVTSPNRAIEVNRTCGFGDTSALLALGQMMRAFEIVRLDREDISHLRNAQRAARRDDVRDGPDPRSRQRPTLVRRPCRDSGNAGRMCHRRM